MSIKKETELMQAILVYCKRCQDEGDIPALKEMGFGPKEVQALANLSSTDAIRLASTRSHFLNISVNQEVYWRMIDYVNREKNKENQINELIRNDAPLPMIHFLTGMGSKEFTLKRRSLGLGNAPSGRPVIPSDDVSDRVWEAVQKIKNGSTNFEARDFLEIHEALDGTVSFRVLWHLIRKWDLDGTLELLGT